MVLTHQEGFLHAGSLTRANQGRLGQLAFAFGGLAFCKVPPPGPRAHDLARGGDFEPLGHRFARLTSCNRLWHKGGQTTTSESSAKEKLRLVETFLRVGVPMTRPETLLSPR